MNPTQKELRTFTKNLAALFHAAQKWDDGYGPIYPNADRAMLACVGYDFLPQHQKAYEKCFNDARLQKDNGFKYATFTEWLSTHYYTVFNQQTESLTVVSYELKDNKQPQPFVVPAAFAWEKVAVKQHFTSHEETFLYGLKFKATISYNPLGDCFLTISEKSGTSTWVQLFHFNLQGVPVLAAKQHAEKCLQMVAEEQPKTSVFDATNHLTEFYLKEGKNGLTIATAFDKKPMGGEFMELVANAIKKDLTTPPPPEKEMEKPEELKTENLRWEKQGIEKQTEPNVEKLQWVNEKPNLNLTDNYCTFLGNYKAAVKFGINSQTVISIKICDKNEVNIVEFFEKPENYTLQQAKAAAEDWLFKNVVPETGNLIGADPEAERVETQTERTVPKNMEDVIMGNTLEQNMAHVFDAAQKSQGVNFLYDDFHHFLQFCEGTTINRFFAHNPIFELVFIYARTKAGDKHLEGEYFIYDKLSELIADQKSVAARILEIKGNGIEGATPAASNPIVPQHYGGANNEFETIKVLFAAGIGIDFCVGNAIKYISRMGKKVDTDWRIDCQKAVKYLELLRSYTAECEFKGVKMPLRFAANKLLKAWGLKGLRLCEALEKINSGDIKTAIHELNHYLNQRD